MRTTGSGALGSKEGRKKGRRAAAYLGGLYGGFTTKALGGLIQVSARPDMTASQARSAAEIKRRGAHLTWTRKPIETE